MQTAPNGWIREIACDESGYEGVRLVGGETDVFAHAGVRLSPGAAADCITELRRRIRSPAVEYKANHLLREKHRPVLEWFLGTAGPVHGHGHVYLVDKGFLAVTTIVALLGRSVPDRRVDASARRLYRAGRGRMATQDWAAFLGSADDLLRARNRREPGSVPALDLLGPALARAVHRWGGDGPISIVHDRQTALTDERISRVTASLAARGAHLTGVRLVDSRSDARVQIADFLAGVARRVASDELGGRGDAHLVALLAPYVDPLSIWGDDRSWSRLAPGRVGPGGCRR